MGRPLTRTWDGVRGSFSLGFASLTLGEIRSPARGGSHVEGGSQRGFARAHFGLILNTSARTRMEPLSSGFFRRAADVRSGW